MQAKEVLNHAVTKLTLAVTSRKLALTVCIVMLATAMRSGGTIDSASWALVVSWTVAAYMVGNVVTKLMEMRGGK